MEETPSEDSQYELRSHSFKRRLRKNSPHRIIYLNTWSIVGATLRAGLGAVGSMEDFEFPKAYAVLSVLSLFLFVAWDISS